MQHARRYRGVSADKIAKLHERTPGETETLCEFFAIGEAMPRRAHPGVAKLEKRPSRYK